MDRTPLGYCQLSLEVAQEEIESLRSEVSALREQKIIDDAMIEGRKEE